MPYRKRRGEREESKGFIQKLLQKRLNYTFFGIVNPILCKFRTRGTREILVHQK